MYLIKKLEKVKEGKKERKKKESEILAKVWMYLIKKLEKVKERKKERKKETEIPC